MFTEAELPSVLNDYILRALYDNRYCYPGDNLIQLGLLLARWAHLPINRLVTFNGQTYRVSARGTETDLDLVITSINNDVRFFKLPLTTINTFFKEKYINNGVN